MLVDSLELEPALYGGVGEQGALNQCGDEVFAVENSFNVEVAEGVPEIAQRQPAGQDVEDSGRHVGDQAHPGNPRAAAARLDGTRQLVAIEQAGKIDASM